MADAPSEVDAPRSRILLRAHRSPFDSHSAVSTLARNSIGSNVGNLLFAHAAHRLLDTAGAEVSTSILTNADPAWINESFDVVVLPLANAFRQAYVADLTRMTEILEKVRVPVVVLGVNAQLPPKASEPKGKISAAVSRFVRAVLRNSPSIGVRGERTKRYLERLGFSDEEVTVVGCPAMFLYGPDLPALRLPDVVDSNSRISLNLSPYVPGLGPFATRLADAYPELVYTAQDLPTLELLLTGRYRSRLPVREGFPSSTSHPLISSGRTVFPLSVVDWIGHLAGFDLSFGTRIHGNIAALLAGTPAIVLTHDSRTAELADYHAIPHLPVSKSFDGLDPATAYASANFSAIPTRHRETWQQFARFLRTHGLQNIYDEGVQPGAFDERMAAIQHTPVATLNPSLRPVVLAAKVQHQLRWRAALVTERLARVARRGRRRRPGG